MATNGVYFGAEIVRDLTPAPGSRMAKRRGKRRERVGWGRVGRGSLHLRLPLSCFSHLHPSVLLCPSVSLPPSSSGCQPPPPRFASSFLGRIPGLRALAPRYPCLRVETRIPGQTRKIPRGPGEDSGAGTGKVPEMSCDSQLPTALLIFPPSLEAPSCLLAAWLWSQRSTWEKLSWSKAGPRSGLHRPFLLPGAFCSSFSLATPSVLPVLL